MVGSASILQCVQEAIGGHSMQYDVIAPSDRFLEKRVERGRAVILAQGGLETHVYIRMQPGWQ